MSDRADDSRSPPEPPVDEVLRLFPLHTVLLPGSTLDLRIFEPRYVELVRDCCRESRPFGVVHIVQGAEVGAVESISPVACSARIVDFETAADGLLGIRIRGERRFHWWDRQTARSGLNWARVRWCADAPIQSVPPQFALLPMLLERLAEHGDSELARAEKARFDDADWVSWRVLERLPCSVQERQKMLEIDQPMDRLQWLIDQFPRFQSE